MTALSTTLRPGLLVSLSTSIKGNVEYAKIDIEGETIDETTGVQTAKWETTRYINDPAEHERAGKARDRARSLVASVCAATAFGYLCPKVDEDKLDKAIADGRAIVEEFNRTAKITRVTFFALTGEIAETDEKALRAINGEVRELLNEMAEGVKNLDVEVIRKAAARTKELGTMLSPEAQVRLELAIKAARDTATKIKKAGETAAQEIDRSTLQRLAEARTAFLDLDGATEVQAPADTTSRALDLTPAAPAPVGSTEPQRQPLEIG